MGEATVAAPMANSRVTPWRTLPATPTKHRDINGRKQKDATHKGNTAHRLRAMGTPGHVMTERHKHRQTESGARQNSTVRPMVGSSVPLSCGRYFML